MLIWVASISLLCSVSILSVHCCILNSTEKKDSFRVSVTVVASTLSPIEKKIIVCEWPHSLLLKRVGRLVKSMDSIHHNPDCTGTYRSTQTAASFPVSPVMDPCSKKPKCGSKLVHYWANVYDVGSTLSQLLVNVSCLVGCVRRQSTVSNSKRGTNRNDLVFWLWSFFRDALIQNELKASDVILRCSAKPKCSITNL